METHNLAEAANYRLNLQSIAGSQQRWAKPSWKAAASVQGLTIISRVMEASRGFQSRVSVEGFSRGFQSRTRAKTKPWDDPGAKEAASSGGYRPLTFRGAQRNCWCFGVASLVLGNETWLLSRLLEQDAFPPHPLRDRFDSQRWWSAAL